MNQPKKLFLLDAYALIYRAYFAFAKNPRINSNGLNTSAIFGFTNTVLEVIKKEQPTHIAVVFDTKKPTERHIEFPEYKAQREAMPEPLQLSLPYIDRLLEALKIPKIYMDGYEADDVIGTIAKNAEKKGFKVYMMTPDKDFAQLVSENIFMYRPASKWQPSTIWGISEVKEKFKINSVEQVIDFLAMTGDAADNIPGIPGVGEKTAQKFLNEFGSLENLYKNTVFIKGKIRDKVESSKDLAFLCKKLVTIITDVPLSYNFIDMEIQTKDEKAIMKLFNELEFHTLLNRVLKTSKVDDQVEIKREKKLSEQFDLFSENDFKTEVATQNINLNCIIVRSKNDMNNLIAKIFQTKKFAIHTIQSHKGSFTNNVVGYIIYLNDNMTYFFSNKLENLKLFQQVLEDPITIKYCHNIKFFIKILKKHNIKLKGYFLDIYIAHYLLFPEKRHSLEVLSENYLKTTLQNEKNVVIKDEYPQDINTLTPAAERAKAIFDISKLIEQDLSASRLNTLYETIEMPLVCVLADMEHEGINIDTNILNSYSVLLSKKLQEYTDDIYNLCETQFNIASPKQLGETLFEKLKLVKKPKKTKSGQYSTSEETLLKLTGLHPVIEKILDYRAIKKLLSTYINALPELVDPATNRIHTTFNQAVTSTGRLSSVNPNLQNIPIRTKRGRRVREAFVPRNKSYTLLAADYSQIELRIMAALSQDQSMIKAFKDGIDIHLTTASKVYKLPVSKVDRAMRSNAKAVNFGIIYGISPFGLSQNIGVSRREAKEIIDQYFDQFPAIKEYMTIIIDRAREFEYVETIMGRRRNLRDINSRNNVIRSFAERNAINAPIQGSAADIIKSAMIKINNEIEKRKLKSKMLLQVHDELVFDMHNSEQEELKELVRDLMENVVDDFSVPLVVEMGQGSDWLEAH